MNIQKIIAALLTVVLGLNVAVLFSSQKEEASVGFSSANNTIVINKELSYTELLTTGVDITNAVVGGKLVIEDIIVKTDSVGMASGTLFQVVTSGNSYGTSTVISIPVNNLGARQTFAMSNDYLSRPVSYTATSTQITVLEDGAKLQALCTAAACRGTNSVAGKVQFTMVFKKADTQAYLYE